LLFFFFFFCFFFFFFIYFSLFRYEKRALAEFVEAEEDQYPDLTLGQALLRYALAGAVVVVAGVWLPFVAEQLAGAMGWTESFVGTLFVAFATSVPELVVTIAAMQIGALDMAIGNLFGSNLFNCLIIAIDDLFYTPGPLLEAVTPAHSVSALSALMMTGVAVVGLLYRPTSRVLKTVGWASIFLFLIYLLNSVMLFLYGV
jgi:cation:H+ antiporter